MNLDFIINHLGWFGAGIVVILMSLIQIAPIKINPWSAIGRLIGKAINGEVLEKVDKLSNDIETNKADSDEQWASLRRSNILKFGDEILHGIKHSKEHFDQILLDISKYEQFCNSHKNYMNNIANATIKHIKDTYQKCLETNDFL